jgi:hypothetical protein
LPTNLPRRNVKPKPSVFTLVLNTFMVGSALILTFMVLLQEERYAMGQPGYFAGTLEQTAQQTQIDTTGQTQVVLPPN